MNLLLTRLTAIIDSKYEREYCKGLGLMGEKKKQVIPSFEEADRYVKAADPGYYATYLEGKHPHPHFTGVYYCPWCDAWHPTTSPEGFSGVEKKDIQECIKALEQGNPCTHMPKDLNLGKDYHFPDYTKEQLQKHFERFKHFNRREQASADKMKDSVLSVIVDAKAKKGPDNEGRWWIQHFTSPSEGWAIIPPDNVDALAHLGCDIIGPLGSDDVKEYLDKLDEDDQKIINKYGD